MMLKRNIINTEKINFKFDNTTINDKIIGIKIKYNRNIETITLLKQIESENRLITLSEPKVQELELLMHIILQKSDKILDKFEFQQRQYDKFIKS